MKSRLFIRAVIDRIRKDGFIRFSCKAIKCLYADCNGGFQYKLLRLKTKGNFLVKDIQGSKMYIDLRDNGICRDLALDGGREPFSIKFLQKTLKKGFIAVDIGSNIGYYALLEARLVGPKGKIFAIEPVPQNMQLLKRNIELNDYSNIEMFQMAIGEENRVQPIYVSSNCNWSSMILADKYFEGTMVDKIDVDVVTLDSFLEDKPAPDFIRMDVEGYEYQIIKGMGGILGSNKPLLLFIELHPRFMEKEQVKYILTQLENSGFKVKALIWEPPPLVHNKLIQYFDKKADKIDEYGFSKLTLDDLLNLYSEKGNNQRGAHLFFERK